MRQGRESRSFTSQERHLSSFISLSYFKLEADTYYELADLEICQQQPPAIRYLSDSEIEDCRMKPLILHHSCHNQTVEDMSNW